MSEAAVMAILILLVLWLGVPAAVAWIIGYLGGIPADSAAQLGTHEKEQGESEKLK